MIRNFANGFLAGLACLCLLGLLWLLAIRPQLTQLQSDHLREEFLLAGPEAERFGALPFSEPLLDLEAMQKQYPDLRAWLTIPGTCVDYPVLQSSSAQPEYYLRRDINGKWRMAGSLFFQSDCQPQSRNLVVFGHNMTDGTMFGSLPELFPGIPGGMTLVFSVLTAALGFAAIYFMSLKESGMQE